MSATGETFKDVPITRSRSTFSRSSAKDLSKSPVNFSPKKVMSGWDKWTLPVLSTTHLSLMSQKASVFTFIIAAGNSAPSLSSSSWLSHSPFALFLLLLRLSGLAGLTTLQTEHIGTLCVRISCSISVPGTRLWQSRQLAVANDPWHCSTRCTPARVSRVSIFCV